MELHFDLGQEQAVLTFECARVEINEEQTAKLQKDLFASIGKIVTYGERYSTYLRTLRNVRKHIKLDNIGIEFDGYVRKLINMFDEDITDDENKYKQTGMFYLVVSILNTTVKTIKTEEDLIKFLDIVVLSF